MRLDRDFFAEPAREVARRLIGARLVRRFDDGRFAVGRIVETEAYVGPEDLACHASRGRTARTEVMFGPPGHAYVFLVYGMHHCLNAVTDPQGRPAAVLLRAIEPVMGIAAPTNGPGRLCRALGIDLAFYGEDLCGERLFVEAGAPRAPVDASARIGVDYAGAWARRRLRFSERRNPFVSGRRGAPRKRLSRPGASPTVALR